MGRIRMSWVEGRGSWVRDPPCIHVMYTYFYAVSNALSQQQFCPRSLSSVYILLFMLLCFYQRLEILETDKALQKNLTENEFLPANRRRWNSIAINVSHVH